MKTHRRNAWTAITALVFGLALAFSTLVFMANNTQAAPVKSAIAFDRFGTDETPILSFHTVTSAADSGPGTLRQALLDAISGDTITFDPLVFPPNDPVTITLSNSLPTIYQGDLTIDGSSAGVVLSGSGIGTSMETLLLDDVSLTLNGGGNQIINGDFSAGTTHWRPRDENSGAVRTIDTLDYHSDPNAYSWSTNIPVGETYTVFDTANSSDPITEWPYVESSSVWIPANGDDQVEVRLWYKNGRIEIALRNISAEGHNHNTWRWNNGYAADWTEAVVNLSLPADSVGVALEIRSFHSQSWTRGLVIQSNGNVVKGLQIIQFPYDGILIENASDNIIGGDRAMGNGPLGEGNLISGNGGHGIQICAESSNNQVLGNYVGTDITGQFAIPNKYSGVALQCDPGPDHTIIGGTTSGTGNLISGNHQHGIRIRDGSQNNQILGNFIGTSADGTRSLGNVGDGISLYEAANNRIGGPTEGERNIITYNQDNGISIRETGSDNNIIQNNWIGFDADSTGGLDSRDLVVADNGTVVLADFGRGVFTSSDSAASWDAANTGLGTLEIEIVAVAPSFTTHQKLWAWGKDRLYLSNDGGGNWSEVSDQLSGPLKSLEVSPNFASDQTLLAAIDGEGFYKSSDGGTTWALVYNSYYADNIAFSPDFENDNLVLAGLRWGGVLRSTDGGNTWTESNTGLPDIGVYDLAFAADGSTVFLVADHCYNDGVYISSDGGQTWTGSGTGLEACGSAWQVALSPNFTVDGIALAAEDQMHRSTDSGATWSDAGNDIFGSRAHALAFSPNFTSDQTVYFANFAGVFISTNGGAYWVWAGANLGDRGNGGRGIDFCCGAGPNQILDNVIGRNRWQGISIWDTQAAGSLIDNNLIGLAPDGLTRAGNGSTNFYLNSAYITITQNTFAAGGHGGLRTEPQAHHLTIASNRFGTDLSGTIAVGNSYDGMTLRSAWVTVRDNLISGNWGDGIYATSEVTSSLFAGNMIGVDASGLDILPNQAPASIPDIRMQTSSSSIQADGASSIGNAGAAILLQGSYNTIGGSSPTDRNIISGNDSYGICITDGGHNNTVMGNYIGTDTTGTKRIENRYGVLVFNGAHDNLIGGNGAGEGNLVSGNLWDGILFWNSDNNTAIGNRIGVDASGITDLGNNGFGIRVANDSSNSLVMNNTVAYNRLDGIQVEGPNSLNNTISQNLVFNNTGLGINLSYGANTELPSPVITTFDLASGTANGTACVGCTIEVFSDEHAEGRWYEGTTIADGAGNWSYTQGSAFKGLEVTATATDLSGNTSEFGQDWPASPPPPPVIASPVCGVTNQIQPVFSGMAQMGSTVQLWMDAAFLGSSTTDDQNRWSIFPQTYLPDAAHLITGTATTIWGTSETSELTLTVDSSLGYDPVGVSFTQAGITQHPRDTSGCVDPSHSLGISLWPDLDVTVQVPIQVPAATAFIEVNAIRYDLVDPDQDDIFTATFTTPANGSLVIVVSVDGQTMQIGSTIDPDGYVYDAELWATSGITETISGVTVTLQVSDTVRNRWVQWDAPLYGQLNPQITGEDGYFSFFTPPGKYRLVVDGSASGYDIYTSADIIVIDNPVRYNIPLLKAGVRIFLPLVVR